MKVVIDTNVIVSGLINPNGAPGSIIDKLLRGDLEIVIDDRILAEYRRVLSYSKFPFSALQVNMLLEFITNLGMHVTAGALEVSLPDPTDQPFLEVARAARVKALITGNLRHFPGVNEAITPSEFLKQQGSF